MQARNCVVFICTSSSFHGDLARMFRKPNTSKKKREEQNESNKAKIKTSEWKNFALNGILVPLHLPLVTFRRAMIGAPTLSPITWAGRPLSLLLARYSSGDGSSLCWALSGTPRRRITCPAGRRSPCLLRHSWGPTLLSLSGPRTLITPLGFQIRVHVPEEVVLPLLRILLIGHNGDHQHNSHSLVSYNCSATSPSLGLNVACWVRNALNT